MSTEGDVVCLAAAGGTELWRKSLPEEYGGSMMKWNGDTDPTR